MQHSQSKARARTDDSKVRGANGAAPHQQFKSPSARSFPIWPRPGNAGHRSVVTPQTGAAAEDAHPPG
jgi:hypothetical protein